MFRLDALKLGGQSICDPGADESVPRCGFDRSTGGTGRRAALQRPTAVSRQRMNLRNRFGAPPMTRRLAERLLRAESLVSQRRRASQFCQTAVKSAGQRSAQVLANRSREMRPTSSNASARPARFVLLGGRATIGSRQVQWSRARWSLSHRGARLTGDEETSTRASSY